MKKLIYCAAALATALFAGSCQQELLDTPAGENTVTYTVEVPEAMTKAIGDGTNVNSLVYEVWKTDEAGERDLVEGTTGIRLYQKTIEFPMIEGRRKANVTLNLVKNQNYTVLFWAQNAEAGAYNTSNLTSVTYKNTYGPEDTKYFSNQEGYAAFYHAEFISETSPRSKRIELRRPFAQVNIATTNSTNDGDDAELYQIKMTSSKVTIKNVPTVFNVAGNVSKATAKETGEEVVNGATPATTTFVFNEAYLPNCASADDQVSTHTVAGQPYEYAAMNYIFANGTVEVTYEINTVLKAIGGSTSTTAKVVNTVYSVPVEENYRTNIVGNLLTSTTEYEVVVDADWAAEADEPYVVEVTSVASAEELFEAIENGTTEGETNIKLEGDIDLNDLGSLFTSKAVNPYTSKLTIPSDVAVTLDLNGKNLTYTSDVMNEGMIQNNGSLVLLGKGNVKYIYTGDNDPNYGQGNYAINNSGNLVVNGPTVSVVKKDNTENTKFAHALYAVNNSGIFTLENGRVENYHNIAVRQWVGNETTASTVTMNGGEIYGLRAIWVQLPNNNTAIAPKGVLNVNGGTLTAWDNAAEYDSGNRLAVYSYSYGNQMKNVEINVTGGTVNGDIALTGGRVGAKVDVEKVTVTGGTINGGLYSYAETALAEPTITVKGGVICDLCVLDYVKSQGEKVEVKLADDVELTSTLKIESEIESITIDGNGKTLTYKGASGGRIIDCLVNSNGANLTIKNLTIINNVSWIERAINYNTNGTLTLENVTIKSAEGCSLNYAINLPGSSDDAKVEIKNCEIEAGAQALNLWGERTMVNVTDSRLYAVDNSEVEAYNAIALNNDGTNSADYSVINVIGGTLEVIGTHAEGSYTVRNNTIHGVVNVSETTVWNQTVLNPVAIIYWEGHDQYYSKNDLNEALEQAVPKHKATGVRMVNDLTLPLAKKAIYGTPVAVQMKNGGVFDGCGNTLSVENPVYDAYVVETYGGTIKNLNITTPAGRGIIISSPNEDIYLDNVLVNGPGYALNTTEHNGQNLVVTNSTFKGWTSLAGLTSVSFTSCTFGENTYAYWQQFGYDQDYDRLIRPYVATAFNACTFEQGFYVDLSALAASAKVTLKDCVCGDVELTVENYEQYITIELPSGRALADCVVFE